MVIALPWHGRDFGSSTLLGSTKQLVDNMNTQNIQRKIILFQNNPRHPSLRLHKLSGELDGIWSISTKVFV